MQYNGWSLSRSSFGVTAVTMSDNPLRTCCDGRDKPIAPALPGVAHTRATSRYGSVDVSPCPPQYAPAERPGLCCPSSGSSGSIRSDPVIDGPWVVANRAARIFAPARHAVKTASFQAERIPGKLIGHVAFNANVPGACHATLAVETVA